MTSVPTTTSVPFSDQASRAFGSSRFSRSPAPTMSEFSESARSAFHSKRKEQDTPSVFPKAFGSGSGSGSGSGHSHSSHSGGESIPRSEFSEAAASAFGGGRRHDYSDQAFSAFGGNGGSGRGDSHPAFGKKERRPLVSSLKPMPLTPAELLIAEAKGKTQWGNSAIASTPTTIADVLKSDALFPALGSSGKVVSTKPSASVASATTSASATPARPSMAAMAKAWSSQHDTKQQRERALREQENLRRAADEHQLEILKSIHGVRHSSHPTRTVTYEEEEDQDLEYVEEQEEPEYDEEDYN